MYVHTFMYIHTYVHTTHIHAYTYICAYYIHACHYILYTRIPHTYYMHVCMHAYIHTYNKGFHLRHLSGKHGPGWKYLGLRMKRPGWLWGGTPHRSSLDKEVFALEILASRRKSLPQEQRPEVPYPLACGPFLPLRIQQYGISQSFCL